MNARIDYDLKAKTGAILFYDLNAEEFDKLRILFKTIFDCGQFPNSQELSQELGLKKMIAEIAVQQQKDETQQLFINNPTK